MTLETLLLLSAVAINVVILSVAHGLTGILSLQKPRLLTLYLYMWSAMLIGVFVGALTGAFHDRGGIHDFALAITLHPLLLIVGYLLLSAGRSTPGFRYPGLSGNQDAAYPVASKNGVYAALLTLAAMIFLHQLVTLGPPPIMYYFHGGTTPSEVMLLREEAFKLRGDWYVYFWNLNRSLFAPAVAGIAFFRALVVGGKASWIVFTLVFILVAANNSLSAALGPVAKLVLILGIIYILVRGTNIAKTKLVAFVPFMLLFPAIVTYAAAPAEGIWRAVKKVTVDVAERFTFGVADRTLSYFELFPDAVYFLGGRTNRLFALLSGQDHFNVTNFVFLQRIDEIQDHLLEGSANAHYIGYMYADFALVGVAVASVVVGGIVGVLQRIMGRVRRNEVAVTMYAIVCVLLWGLMGKQPTTIFGSEGVLLAILVAVASSVFVLRNRWRSGAMA